MLRVFSQFRVRDITIGFFVSCAVLAFLGRISKRQDVMSQHLQPSEIDSPDAWGLDTAPSKKVIDMASSQFPEHIFSQVNLSSYDILMVGAGLSTTVLADLYARKHNKKVLIIDRRPHIGGNCYDFVERESGILINLYGAHLFHTSKERVWQYVHRFSEWTPYEHRVVGRVDDKMVPIPVNIDTVNALLNENIQSVKEMESFMKKERKKAGLSKAQIDSQANSEVVAKSRVGQRLFDKLFKEYTKKQWNVFPSELGPEVLSRIPVREDWDDRYFPNDPYQALPRYGYTAWFKDALNHPNIRVFTSTDYFEFIKHPKMLGLKFEKVFFTGQIDQYFRDKGSQLKPLQYRSIKFETVVTDENSVKLPVFVLNFPQFKDGMHTRTAEYKHMYHQGSKKSVLIKEFSTDITDGAEPYYPFPTPENQKHFEQYKKLAAEEEKSHNVYFVGRLANYKYFNMDDAIENALQLYERLEGPASLESALAEAKLDKTQKLIVHLVVTVHTPNDANVLAKLSASLTANFKLVEIQYFVFNSNAELQLQFFLLFDEACRTTSGCINPIPGQSFFIRSDPLYRQPRFAWLEYFFQNTFSFGDSNIFFDLTSNPKGPRMNKIISAIGWQQTILFSEQMSRASQSLILKRNIRKVTIEPNELGRYDKIMTGVSDDSSNLNLAHYIPLEDYSGEAASYISRKKMCPGFSSNIDFVASEAIIRRMLAVHRTLLFDTYRPDYVAENERVQYIQDWICLFFDFT